ncbi:recombination regulator RecX [Ornithinimicrobium faecis]|uniref:Regulatory protein RecX n=1 Tax=Ornithinimicrobium faecis TaxID=2934158 RepID=A0ABY4YQ79_9MICO|nr:regulatory protein RecX [Ornithinimicrobium sp. HY1793]USQ78863.1 recombination regulator RecX [Ornithinimicrobium sp. HY1793]
MSDSTPQPGPADRLARAREVLAAAEAGEPSVDPTPPTTTTRRSADRAPDSRRRDGSDTDVPESVRGDAEADPHDVARQIALRQLTMAPRSRKQLEDKLRQKGCADEVSHVVLDRLEEVGLIDDAAYARMLVRTRQETKGLAPRALSQELRRKGVSDDLIEDALADIASDDQHVRARELVDKRLRTMRGLDPQVQTRRLAGFLARKGYDSNVAFGVIREALADLPEHQRD